MSYVGILKHRYFTRGAWFNNMSRYDPSLQPFLGITPLLISERGAKAKAGAGSVKAKGSKGGAMQKKILDVEEDAHKLVSQVCGLNYQIDSEPIMIKPDSEYPDWLWTLEVKRPLPPLEERDPNTKEYWLQVQRDVRRERNKLMKLKKR